MNDSAFQPAASLSNADWVVWGGGSRRYVHRWAADQTPKACVGIIHGLGEHGGRYASLAGELVAKGFLVLAFDQQGHGLDPGKRGVAISYQSLLDDVGHFLRWSRTQAINRPCYLLGHSMGGNLVTNYSLREQQLPDAIIASSPMFKSPREPKGLLNTLARVANRIMPNWRIGAGIRFEDLTDDPAEQERVARDTLYHRLVSLSLGAAMIDSGRWAIDNADKLTVPMLITHAIDDRLTLAEGSAEFARRCGSKCQLHRLTNHRHETFRDLRKRDVIDLFLGFLDQQQHRIASKPS